MLQRTIVYQEVRRNGTIGDWHSYLLIATPGPGSGVAGVATITALHDPPSGSRLPVGGTVNPFASGDGPAEAMEDARQWLADQFERLGGYHCHDSAAA